MACGPNNGYSEFCSGIKYEGRYGFGGRAYVASSESFPPVGAAA
jgi:hypothetical protein